MGEGLLDDVPWQSRWSRVDKAYTSNPALNSHKSSLFYTIVPSNVTSIAMVERSDDGPPSDGRRTASTKLKLTLESRIKSANTTPTRATFASNDECLLRSPKKYNSWTTMTPHRASQRYLSTRGGSYDVRSPPAIGG